MGAFICVCQRAADPDTICLTVQAQECATLMRLVWALRASRSKLVAGKSIMAKEFAELQQICISILSCFFPCTKAWKA